MEWCATAGGSLLIVWWGWSVLKNAADRRRFSEEISRAAHELERSVESALAREEEQVAAQAEEARIIRTAWALAFPKKAKRAQKDHDSKMDAFLDGRELHELPAGEQDEYWAFSASLEDASFRLKKAWWRKKSPADKRRYTRRVQRHVEKGKEEAYERFQERVHESAVQWKDDFADDITVEMLEEAAEEMDAIIRAGEEDSWFSSPRSDCLLYVWMNRTKPEVLDALRDENWEELATLVPTRSARDLEYEKRRERSRREDKFFERLDEELRRGTWTAQQQELIRYEVSNNRSRRE